MTELLRFATAGSVDDGKSTLIGRLLYDSKAIFVDQDQQATMQAFMGGKIKVQGDMTKLMAMQAAPPDATQVEAAGRIAEITA